MSTKSIKLKFLNFMIFNGKKYTSEKLLLDSLKSIQKKKKKFKKYYKVIYKKCKPYPIYNTNKT